jgi:hypothetical protein
MDLDETEPSKLSPTETNVIHISDYLGRFEKPCFDDDSGSSDEIPTFITVKNTVPKN